MGVTTGRDDDQPLGLRRGTVSVLPSHAAWPALFEHERRRLLAAVGHLVVDVQHVGSTAVPGLPAKPIIDVAVAVADVAVVAQLRRPLADLGYEDRGDKGTDGGHLFVRERAPGVRTHHLHVVPADDPQWTAYLRLRDALRADASLRARYAALKAELAARFAADRTAYTAGKRSLIKEVLRGGRPGRGAGDDRAQDAHGGAGR